MKIIDLLNKIAKGELEDLTLVHFCKNNCLTKYHKADNRFEFMDKGDWNNYFHLIDIEELNEEVAIIENLEEVEDKEYEDIGEIRLTGRGRIVCTYNGEQHFIDTNIKDKEVYIPLINALIRNQQKIIEVLNDNNKNS